MQLSPLLQNTSLLAQVDHIAQQRVHRAHLHQIYTRKRSLLSNTSRSTKQHTLHLDATQPISLRGGDSKPQSMKPRPFASGPKTDKPLIIGSNMRSISAGFDLLHRMKTFRSSAEVNRLRRHQTISRENVKIKSRLEKAAQCSPYSQANLRKLSSRSWRERYGGRTDRGGDYSCWDNKQEEGMEGDRERECNLGFITAVDDDLPTVAEKKTKCFQRSKTQCDEGNNYAHQSASHSLLPKGKHNRPMTGILAQLQPHIDQVLAVRFKTERSATYNSGDFNSTKTPKCKQSHCSLLDKKKKAAMLHFRKMQKLNNTQSKFWRVPSRGGVPHDLNSMLEQGSNLRG